MSQEDQKKKKSSLWVIITCHHACCTSHKGPDLLHWKESCWVCCWGMMDSTTLGFTAFVPKNMLPTLTQLPEILAQDSKQPCEGRKGSFPASEPSLHSLRMEWGPQDLISQDPPGHLGWPYKGIRVPSVHLRVDGYPSAPIMSLCRRTHWDGKGQRSQSSWTLADVFSFIHTVLWKFPNFVPKARFPVSFAKPEDLARQAWVPDTKALRGHLLPCEQGSPLVRTPVPTTPHCLSSSSSTDAEHVPWIRLGGWRQGLGLSSSPSLPFPLSHTQTHGVVSASITPVLWWHLPLCTRVPLLLCPSTSWLFLCPLNSET